MTRVMQDFIDIQFSRDAVFVDIVQEDGDKSHWTHLCLSPLVAARFGAALTKAFEDLCEQKRLRLVQPVNKSTVVKRSRKPNKH
jgi:hypothetical protein